MSTTIGLAIQISAVDKTAQVISGLISKLTGSSGLTGALAGVGVAAGALAVDFGVRAVQAAGQFQTAMLASVSHAGLAKDQVQGVTDAILQMGPAVGQIPVDLANAIYPIYSGLSGISERAGKSALALDDLQMAGESVAGTTANLNDVAYAATSTFNAFGMATNNQTSNIAHMNQIYDEMNRAVTDGNMKMGDFSRVAGQLANATHQAGFALSEGYAALDVFTNSGTSTQKANMYLTTLFLQMSTGMGKMVVNSKKMGLGFDENKYSAMNLADRIKYLDTITSQHHENRIQQQAELQKLLGNQRNLTSFNMLDTNRGNLQANQKDIQGSKGATNTALDTASQGIEFKMKQAQAAFSSFMISIGNALLPIATQLMGALAPLIARFSAWVQQSGIMKTIATGLAGALSLVVGAISTLVTVGANVVGFFQHNQLAMDGLKAVLAGVAAGILAFAIVSIPPLIVAFGAWAIAAGAAALATLAAAAPFILIGVVVAAVVFGIIEAVRNWGAIAHWLQGVWGAIAGFFKEVWKKIVEIFTPIGQWFADRWSEVVAVFSGVVDFFSGLFEMAWIALTVIFGPIGQWFQDRWNEVTAIFSTVWNAISSFLSGVWNTYVVGPLSALWNNVSTFFKNAWTNYIATPLSNLWNSIKTAFTNAWDIVKKGAETLWNAVSGFFGKIWDDYLKKPMTDIWNNISQGFVGLVSKAATWGRDLAHAFIDAMKAAFTSNPAIGTPFGGNILQWVMGNVNTKLQGHAMGGTIGPGESGYVGDTGGKPEFLYGGMHGITVYNPAQTQAMFGGRGAGGGGGVHYHYHNISLVVNTPLNSDADVDRLADRLETVWARRFRSQTPSYSSGGAF